MKHTKVHLFTALLAFLWVLMGPILEPLEARAQRAAERILSSNVEKIQFSVLRLNPGEYELSASLPAGLSAKSLVLSDHGRVVLDIVGYRARRNHEITVSGDPLVIGARVGAHPDKMRIVIDLAVGERPNAAFNLIPATGGGNRASVIFSVNHQLASTPLTGSLTPSEKKVEEARSALAPSPIPVEGYSSVGSVQGQNLADDKGSPTVLAARRGANRGEVVAGNLPANSASGAPKNNSKALNDKTNSPALPKELTQSEDSVASNTPIDEGTSGTSETRGQKQVAAATSSSPSLLAPDIKQSAKSGENPGIGKQNQNEATPKPIATSEISSNDLAVDQTLERPPASLGDLRRARTQSGVQSADRSSQLTIVEDIVFDRSTAGEIPFVRIILSTRPTFEVLRKGSSEYEFLLAKSELAGIHLALPRFPPKDFEGFTHVTPERVVEQGDTIRIRVGMDEGYQLRYLPKDNEIWLRSSK